MAMTFVVAGQSNAFKQFDIFNDQVTALHSAGAQQTFEYTLSEAVQARALTITLPIPKHGQALFISGVTVNGVAMDLTKAIVVPPTGPPVAYGGQFTTGTLTIDLSSIAPRTPGPNGPSSPVDYDVVVTASGARTNAEAGPSMATAIDGIQISGLGGAQAFAEAARHYFADPSVTMISTGVGGSTVDDRVNPTASPTWWHLDTNQPGPLLLDAVAAAKASGQPVTGIIWAQGEQEAINLSTTKPTTSVDRYIQSTEAGFAYFRAALGQPNLPIFIQELGPDKPANKPDELNPFFDVIRAAQIKIAAETPHVSIAASTYDLDIMQGGIHFTPQSYVAIGQRLAAFVAADLGAPNAASDPQPRMAAAQVVDHHTLDVRLAGFAAGDVGQVIAPQFFAATDANAEQAPLTAVWKSADTIELSFGQDFTSAVSLAYVDGAQGWLWDRPLMSTAGPVALPMAPGVLAAHDESWIVASGGSASAPAQWLLDALPGGGGSAVLTSVTGEDGLSASLAAGANILLTTPHAGAYELQYTTTGGGIDQQGVVALQVVAGGTALIGTEQADVIVGSAGDDTLDGGAGSDALYGGAGNDAYTVDDPGDRVIELAGGGVDTVRTSLSSFSIPANVEVLVYTGAGDFSGKGSGHAETLIGGPGDDLLDGGAGADVLQGGLGNDTYVVDNVGDKVIEAPGGGVDTVRTVLASYALGADVENLVHTGAGAFTGTGNGLANLIVGGSGADVLAGAAGADVLQGGSGADRLIGGADADTLTGGAGADIFVFNAVSDSTGQAHDLITDFDATTDKLDLWFAVSGVGAAIAAGSLSTASFDQDLAAAVNAGHLASHQAVLFTPSAGGLAGETFLIVDVNGVAGYQAGADLVIDLHHPLHIASFGPADFI